jgi:hypothetical protein
LGQTLAEFALEQAKRKDEKPDAMPLGFVLVRYWQEHPRKLPSHDQARAGAALWTEFFGPVTIADLTIQGQAEFVEWLKAKGYKNSYVSRTLSVGRAAIYRAWKRGELSLIDES